MSTLSPFVAATKQGFLPSNVPIATLPSSIFSRKLNVKFVRSIFSYYFLHFFPQLLSHPLSNLLYFFSFDIFDTSSRDLSILFS